MKIQRKTSRHQHTHVFKNTNSTGSSHVSDDVSFAFLPVVDGESIVRAQHKLVQVQPQWPGVLGVQSPDTEHPLTPRHWRWEGPIKGLMETSTRPLDGSRRHTKILLSTWLLWIHLVLASLLHPMIKKGVPLGWSVGAPAFVYGSISLGGSFKGPVWIRRSFTVCVVHFIIAAQLIGAKAFTETLHLTVTAPGEGDTPTPEAFERRLGAIASWMKWEHQKVSKGTFLHKMNFEQRVCHKLTGRMPKCRTSGVAEQKQRHRKLMRIEVMHQGDVSSWKLQRLWQLGAAKNVWLAASWWFYGEPFVLTPYGELSETEEFTARTSMWIRKKIKYYYFTCWNWQNFFVHVVFQLNNIYISFYIYIFKSLGKQLNPISSLCFN